MTTETTAASGSSTKILIVDDHPIVRRGLASLLNREADILICGEAGDAESALELLRLQLPDIAIVDISLPGVSGLELVKQIKARYAQLPVLVLSMHDESLYLERAFKAGARGYMMKEQAAEHIVLAIRKILAGDLYISDSMQTLLLGRMLSGMSDSSRPALTDREYEVLRLIGLGLGTAAIAAELRRSVKTIESHRANLKDKLGLKSAAELARYATRWVENELNPPDKSD